LIANALSNVLSSKGMASTEPKRSSIRPLSTAAALRAVACRIISGEQSMPVTFARRQLGGNQLDGNTRSVPNFQNSVIRVNIQQFDHLYGYLSVRPRHDDAA
jgi:hypothetical protein